MLTYSIAIRTLGKGGEMYREELRSIMRQTVRPERVLVYIAEDCPRPDFTEGDEEYIPVPRGMMAQRILPYDEITSDCILMLDDDVRLAPDSAEKLLGAMEEHDADCVGADVFRNQDMPVHRKLYAAVTGLVFPHHSSKWAFKLRRNGSFSYNGEPKERCYPSQTCGGPALLWRRDAFLRLHLEDELWLDTLPFSYNDDTLISYKLYSNGGRLFVLYGSGVDNLDASSFSSVYRKSPDRIRVRSEATFMIWWRTCFRNGADNSRTRMLAAGAFALKSLWMVPVMAAASVVSDPRALSMYFKGLADGWRSVHTPEFRDLNKYVIR
jgi:cellulose synthase/poly-beta-1,6-N-acetylglucosamine synthase-like glycosyltransferase